MADNKEKTIPRHIGERIQEVWAKLPAWRKIPSDRNIKRFLKELDLPKEDTLIVVETLFPNYKEKVSKKKK